VHAAVDAAGKTADEVARGIAASLSLPDGTGGDLADRVELLGTPVVIVVNEVDAAEDPVELISLVLEPIAAHAPRTGSRLLLGFGGAPPGRLRAAVALNLAGTRRPVSGSDAGPVDHDDFAPRIAKLVERTNEVAASERDVSALHERVALRILGTPRRRLASGSALAVRLRIIQELRLADAGSASARATRDRPGAELEACERMAADALERAARTTRELEDLLTQRDRLRGHLRAYRALAASHGLIEELGEQYRAAWVLLYSGAADLRLARQTVTAYHAAVRRAIEEGDGS
jgi:hypothetical protein